MARLGITVAGEQSTAQMAARSQASLDQPLRADGELWVAIATDEARILGAFQRAGEPLLPGAPQCLVRRESGGPLVLVGPGTVHVALSLARPASLTACDEKQIVNRYVRPLLRALTAVGSPAAFFGRDWISVSKQPAAWVGFAHDAGTGRTLFEAFIAVSSPFALGERESFRGKSPGTLSSIGGRAVSPARVAQAIVAAYAEGHDIVAVGSQPDDIVAVGSQPEPAPAYGALAVASEPPWAATCDEVIGLLGAGPDSRGVFRIGGDLLVSRDALARLESRTAGAGEAEIGPLVDSILAAPGVALDGVRTLTSLQDVIVRALRGR